MRTAVVVLLLTRSGHSVSARSFHVKWIAAFCGRV
jgi:hypothetical protein